MDSKTDNLIPRSVRISQSEWEQYRKAAQRKQSTISNLIRDRMAIYTKQKEPPNDR